LQIKFSMALPKIYWPWIISESWYYVKKPISLCRTVLFDVDFQLRFVQTPLSVFAYPAWVAWITNARSSSHSNLVYMFKRMALTPHVVMLRSRRMWLKANFTSVGLNTLSVYYKSTWNLSHSKNACLLALTIAFCSL
jgi:hypothetical protein